MYLGIYSENIWAEPGAARAQLQALVQRSPSNSVTHHFIPIALNCTQLYPPSRPAGQSDTMLSKLLSISAVAAALLFSLPLASAHGIHSDADRDHTDLSWAEIHMLGTAPPLSPPSCFPI